MKVLYLYDNYPSYRKDFFSRLNEALLEKGHRFTFYYGSKSSNASQQGSDSSFPLKAFPIKEYNFGAFSLMGYLGFKKSLKELKPDVVVLQFHVAVLSYWWAYFYMKRKHIPFIIWDCNYTRDTLGGVFVKLRKKLVDFTFKKAAACITYGSVFRDYLLKLGKRPEEVFVAQNTINIQKIMDNRSATCGERCFNHPLRVLYVGALLDRKFVDSSIIAIANLIEQGYDVYYDIVGDGAEFEKLTELVRKLNVEERIILHGAKYGTELKAFFEKDDLFLMPGTGGLAVNEAMAYALPILSTIGDDTVVDLIDGNGFLLKDFGNVEEIKGALKSFIDLPEEKKIAMSHRSEQIVKERASLENMVNQHINAIEYVLNKVGK